MARSNGLTAMPPEAVRSVLKRERDGTHDRFLPLSRVRLDLRDPLAAPENRYSITLSGEGAPVPLRLSPTALRQLAGLGGIPLPFLERLPAAMGLSTLRSCLFVAMEERQDPELLFRLRTGDPPRLRAILPSSFPRFDDRDVLEEVQRAIAGRKDVRVAGVSITDDVFSVRLVVPRALNLGSARTPDPAYAGVDIRTSETGACPMEIRRVLYRLVCSNGMTDVAETQRELRRRKVGLDRDRFREVFAGSLEESLRWGRQSAERLGSGHSQFIQDPVAEVRGIFRRYRLGNPASLPGRLVLDDLARSVNLLGVSRFDLVQAFTHTAQKLDLEDRLRFEDAMGAYLYSEINPN